VGKIANKQSEGVRFSLIRHLKCKLKCQKNTLLQTGFSAILPTGFIKQPEAHSVVWTSARKISLISETTLYNVQATSI